MQVARVGKKLTKKKEIIREKLSKIIEAYELTRMVESMDTSNPLYGI